MSEMQIKHVTVLEFWHGISANALSLKWRADTHKYKAIPRDET